MLHAAVDEIVEEGHKLGEFKGNVELQVGLGKLGKHRLTLLFVHLIQRGRHIREFEGVELHSEDLNLLVSFSKFVENGTPVSIEEVSLQSSDRFY